MQKDFDYSSSTCVTTGAAAKIWKEEEEEAETIHSFMM